LKLYDPFTGETTQSNFNPIQYATMTGKLALDKWEEGRQIWDLPKQFEHTWQHLWVLMTMLDLPGTVDAESMDHLAWSTNWVQYGCPSFQLSHSLASALILTDCRGLSTEEVQWPYESFLMLLPQPKSPFRFYAVANPTQETEGAWVSVHRYTALTQAALVTFYDQLAEYQKSLRLLNDLEATRGLLNFVLNECRDLEYVLRTHVRIMSPDGDSLYQADKWPKEGPIEGWLSCKQAGGLTEDLDLRTVKAASRVVVNTCIYVNTQVREGTREFKIAQPKLDREGKIRPHTWMIGSEIKLPREMREAATAYVQRGHDKSLYRVYSRFTVRGHYQAFWYGSKKSDQRERRSKWIQPYWKGPENGPQITSRLYDVDQKK
jgi:hypothetical protein